MSTVTSKTILDNLWIGASTLGSSVLAILGYGFAVSILGESQAGIVGVMLGVMTMGAAVGSFGINLALVREASKGPLGNCAMSAEIGVASIVAIIVGLLCLAVMVFAGPTLLTMVKYQGDQVDAESYSLLVGAAVLFTQLSGVGRALNQSQCDFRTSSVIDLVASFLQSAGTIIMVYYYRNLTAIGIITFLVAGVQFTAYWFFLRRKWGLSIRPVWSHSAFLRLWRFGRWPYWGSIFAILGDSFDKILVGGLFGSVSVPAYSMAKSFYSQSHALLASQAYSLFPRLAATGRVLGIEQETKLISFVSLISGWIYLSIFLVGPVLAAISAGGAFADKVSYGLGVFCLMGWANSLCLIVYFSKLATGYSKLVMIMNAFSGPGTLLAMWLLGELGGLRFAIAGQVVMLGGVFWLLSLDESNRSVWKCLVQRLRAAAPTGLYAAFWASLIVWFRNWESYFSGFSIAFAVVFLLIYIPLAIQLSRRLPGGGALRDTMLAVVVVLPITTRATAFLRVLLGLNLTESPS